MTKKDFDNVKVGDILTNKITTNCVYNGYDYVVVGKTENEIEVKVLSSEEMYTIKRDEIESCLDLRKVRERNKPQESWISKSKYEIEHEQELLNKRIFELGMIRGRKEIIEKACEWLSQRCKDYGWVESRWLEDFSKAMEEK